MIFFDMDRALPLHEWLIIFLLIALMSMIVLVTTWKGLPARTVVLGEPHHLISPTIDVQVEGAVEKPGLLTLKRGSCLQDALLMTSPLPEADLKGLKLKKALRDGQVIRVPRKRLITIFLEGAVQNPGPLQVWEGTKREELLTQIAFLPEADLKSLKKKQKLNDQEIVIVTLRKTKKKNKDPGLSSNPIRF